MLVVGPSGAGKDTVIGLAKVALAGDPRFRFVRRVITRPADPCGEDHQAVSLEEFKRRQFALSWEAHGLRYGIPLDIAGDLARGVVVVANVSRGVIENAAGRLAVHVIEVTASPETLARRLAARGRETADDVMKRLSRIVPIPSHVAVDTIVNDASPARAASRLLEVLTRAASSAPPG